MEIWGGGTGTALESNQAALTSDTTGMPVMDSKQRSGGHAGRALVVSVAAVVVALAVAGAVAVLANRGTVDVRLGDDTAEVGNVENLAEAIDAEGPLVLPDVASGDRDVIVQHIGGDPNDGWLAIVLRPAGTPRQCQIVWQPDEELFRLLNAEGEETEDCDGTEYPADGGDLPKYDTYIEDDKLFIDLR